MKDSYYRELADFMLKRNKSAASGIDKIIGVLPKEVQTKIRREKRKKRDDLIKRLKTDDEFRLMCEERKHNMENLIWNFGKK